MTRARVQFACGCWAFAATTDALPTYCTRHLMPPKSDPEIIVTEEEKPTQLLSMPQVGARLACSRAHVYRLIAAGELRAVSIKAAGVRPKVRVREDDLEAFIEAHTVAPLAG